MALSATAQASQLLSALGFVVAASLAAGASPRPRGEPLVAPIIRRASRSACAPRQCPITLLREGDMLTTNMTVSICYRQYGPLSVHVRCYERSIPAPTLSVEGGHASSLPTMLRINLRSVLASSEFDATLTMEMIDKDEFGTVETFLVLDSVPFDMIPLAFIQVGTPPLVEVMQVAAVNATTSVTVIRAMRQTKMLVHPVGSPVKVLDISRCDALRQANRTNVYVHGLHTQHTLASAKRCTSPPPYASAQCRQFINNATFVSSEIPEEAFDIAIPHMHPRGTFWYSPRYKSSCALQVGGGMAGMFIIEDDPLVTPPSLLYMEEVHMILTHLSFVERPAGHPLRFQHLGFVQKSIFDGANIFRPYAFNMSAAQSSEEWHTDPNFSEYVDFTLTNGQYVPHLALPRGAARRFRVLNAAAAMTYELALTCAEEGACTISACETWLVAQDGAYLSKGPLLVDTAQASLLLFPGNRIDFVLQCSQEMQVQLSSSPRAQNHALLGPQALRSRQRLLTIAITSGDQAGEVVREPVPDALPPLPLYMRADLSEITEEELFRYKVVVGGGGSREVSYVSPPTPYQPEQTLTQSPDPAAMLPDRRINGDTFGAGSVRHCVAPNSVHEWEIQAADQRLSTFTLEGHHFQVMTTSAERQSSDIGTWRDVYGVGGGSKVTIRFRATNSTGNYQFSSTIASDFDLGQVVVVEVSEKCGCPSVPCSGAEHCTKPGILADRLIGTCWQPVSVPLVWPPLTAAASMHTFSWWMGPCLMPILSTALAGMLQGLTVI